LFKIVDFSYIFNSVNITVILNVDIIKILLSLEEVGNPVSVVFL
jgi:hypothetical protein